MEQFQPDALLGTTNDWQVSAEIELGSPEVLDDRCSSYSLLLCNKLFNSYVVQGCNFYLCIFSMTILFSTVVYLREEQIVS